MTWDKQQAQHRLIAGSTLGAGVLLAVALFVMLNYLACRHYQRFDWTSGKLYSLSEKSLAVLGELDREIELVIFLEPESEAFTAADELATRYQAANPQLVKKRVVDPARNLLAARQLVEEHGVEHANVIVVASGDDRRVIDEYQLVEYDYSGAQYGQPPTLQEFKGEQQITSAILALIEARKPRVLFTTGHGEAPIADPSSSRALSQARDLLGQDNFEIEEWSSLGPTEVPAATDLIVIAGPTTNFLAPELESFKRYLDGGGRMLVLLDPVLAANNRLVDLGLSDWLAGYGVNIADDIIIDPASEMPFFGPETIYTDAWGVHPVVETLKQIRLRVLLPLARSVAKADEPAAGVEITELLKTSEQGWGETNLADLEAVARDDDDLAGPVPLAVAVSFLVGPAPAAAEDVTETEEEVDAEQGRLVVIGDCDFATDAQLANAGNGVLLLNALNWLVRREQLIEVAGRKPQETRLSLSRSELQSVYWLVLILMPGLSVGLGVSVFFRRRR